MTKLVSKAAEATRRYDIKIQPFDANGIAAAVARLAARTTRDIARKLGPQFGTLSAVPVRHPDDDLTIHIQSSALAHFGGGTFNFIGGSAFCPEVITPSIGAEIVEAARHALNNREEVIAMVEQTKGILAEALARNSAKEFPPRVVGIGVLYWTRQPGFQPVVNLESLGHDLWYGPEYVVGTPNQTFSARLDERLGAHSARAPLLITDSSGRSGRRISMVAAEVLPAAGMYLTDAMQQLTRRRMLSFDFDSGRKLAGLWWEEGVLECSFWEYNNDRCCVSLCNNVLTFDGKLPESILATIVERRLGEIMEHPLLHKQTKILQVFNDAPRDPNSQDPEQITLHVSVPTSLISPNYELYSSDGPSERLKG